MKNILKRLFLFGVLSLIVVLMVVPSYASSVTNLIDENSATWENKPANGNDVTFDFNGGKLTATAPGAWPYVLGTYNTPITFVENANPRIRIKFSVEDDDSFSLENYEPGQGTYEAAPIWLVSSVSTLSAQNMYAAASIRLINSESGQAVYIHHFVEGASFDSSGDIYAGTYTLDLPFFDMKAHDGNEDNQWMGTKDFELTNGAVSFDKIQVWCSGTSSNIVVTIDYFEIYYADEEGSDPEESDEPEDSDEPEESTIPEESSIPEESTKPEESTPKPQPGDSGILTLTIFAVMTIGAGGLIARRRRGR